MQITALILSYKNCSLCDTLFDFRSWSNSTIIWDSAKLTIAWLLVSLYQRHLVKTYLSLRMALTCWVKIVSTFVLIDVCHMSWRFCLAVYGLALIKKVIAQLYDTQLIKVFKCKRPFCPVSLMYFEIKRLLWLNFVLT
jgi:hypothetical protein